MIKANPGWTAYYEDANKRVHTYSVEAWSEGEEYGLALVVDYKTGRLTPIKVIADMYDLTFKLVARHDGGPVVSPLKSHHLSP
jgi:hypothetical protein